MIEGENDRVIEFKMNEFWDDGMVNNGDWLIHSFYHTLLQN